MKRVLRKFMKQNKKYLVIESLILLVIIILVVIAVLGIINKDNDTHQNLDNSSSGNKEPVKENISIIDVNSKSRPIAVMIDNSDEARKVQRGLQDAYLVYEIINYADGRTRFEALYKDANVAEIAPIRSARHYHLDYALENDAIFVHWGYSPLAEIQIKSLKINNINGLVYGNTYFWTPDISGVNVSHRRFTSIEKLQEGIEKFKYRTETDTANLLNYSLKEIDNSNASDSTKASEVTLYYAKNNYVTYKYDSAQKTYLRYVKGEEHIDNGTNKQLTVKNIIAYKIKNVTMDSADHQDLKNIGSGDGYYITDGVARSIKWSKECRECQTKYSYLNGEEIMVNDGNTFIQIIPDSQELKIS